MFTASSSEKCLIDTEDTTQQAQRTNTYVLVASNVCMNGLQPQESLDW